MPERFHVELRQRLHQGRAFNLTADQLRVRFLEPWLAGGPVELDEHQYEPGRAKLRVLRGPELAPEQIGLGRGWQNAERAGSDVTEDVLRSPAPAPAASGTLAEFKLAVEGACALESRTLAELVALAAIRHPGTRVSEQLTLAERAVWELLHEHRLALLSAAHEPVAPEAWPDLLLAWPSWRDAEGPRVGAAGGEAA